MTLRLAHLADLHFGEDIPGLAEQLAADVRAHAPDAVVVSGDLTRRARRAEFAAAFAFLATLDAPFLPVPGNHDIPAANLWARLVHPRRRWQAMAPAPAPLRAGKLALIGLDTVARGQWHLDWSAGAIGPRRRAKLAALIGANAPDPIVVVSHHPLQQPSGTARREMPRGATRTVRLLTGAGVRALLCGHLHHPSATMLDGPARHAHRPVQIVAPSALSPRGDGTPNGWNLVEISETGLRASTRQFTGGAWEQRLLISFP